MKEYEVGHWIKRKMNDKAGWITSKNERGIMGVEFLDGTSTFGIYPYQLESYEAILPEVKEEAKRIFVELALMTRDEEWFREITAK